MAAMFSVLLVTAAPPGQSAESGGVFVKLDNNRETLFRSVELFLNRDNIQQICVAFSPEKIEDAKRKFGSHFSFSGVKVLTGGPRWMDQVAAFAEKLSEGATHVIVHDGARPAVPYGDIDAILETACQAPAAALATPVRNPLVELDEGGSPIGYHTADRFMNLLTPQAFDRATFLEMARTKREVHASKITLVKASPLNVRVSGPADASFVRAMINQLPKPKIKANNPFEEAQW